MKREWLIKLRENKKISQQELARMVQSTQATISAIENGYRRPSYILAQKLGKILGFNWIIFYENHD